MDKVEPVMTLRDYFAAQALISILQSMGNGIAVSGWQENAAWMAYSAAEAMLKQRNTSL